MLTSRRKQKKAMRARSRKHSGPGRSIGLRSSEIGQVVRQVQAGFPFSRLVSLQKATALSWEQLARVIQIPRRTLVRRESEGRLRPDESDRVLRVSNLFDRVVDLFEGNHAFARQWLQTPQPGLGGEIPLELATTDIGAREVENLVCRLDHGVFA